MTVLQSAVLVLDPWKQKKAAKNGDRAKCEIKRITNEK